MSTPNRKLTVKDTVHTGIRGFIGMGSGMMVRSLFQATVATPANPYAALAHVLVQGAMASMIGDKTADHTIEKYDEMDQSIRDLRESVKKAKETPSEEATDN